MGLRSNSCQQPPFNAFTALIMLGNLAGGNYAKARLGNDFGWLLLFPGTSGRKKAIRGLPNLLPTFALLFLRTTPSWGYER